MTFTTNQWAIIVLVLVLGWILGLASRSSAGRYRRAANDERIRREMAEERVAALNARVAELERGATAPGLAAVAPVETVNPIVDPPAYPHDA